MLMGLVFAIVFTVIISAVYMIHSAVEADGSVDLD